MVEKDSPYPQGRYPHTPLGVLLHGSRSGVAGNPTATEFLGTATYATVEPNGLAWTATIGDDALALHLPLNQWGWHARACSPLYVGAEFAQATVNDPISDAQVRAFCWLFQQLRGVYPDLPRHFPTHAEVDGTTAYGGTYDGKTDCYPRGDPRADELRARIAARLDALGVR